MSTISDKSKKAFLISTGILAIFIPFLYTKPLFLTLFALVYYIFIISFFNKKLALFLLILLRPCLDLLSKETLFTFIGFNINFAVLFGGLVLFLSFIIVLKDFNKIKKAPLLIPWILFLLAAFAFVFTSFNLASSAREWFRLLSIFSLYILGFSIVETKKDLVTLVKVIILSTLIPSIFAIYQYHTQTGMSIPFEGIYNRIFGTFAHPNLFAYYLVMPILLSVAVFVIGNKKRVSNLILPAYFIFLSMLLILTYTRGAWLVFIIALITIALFKSRILLIILFISLFSSYIIIEPINTRVDDLLRHNPYGSVQWRKDLWKDSLEYVKQEPIIGHGTGTAKELILNKRGERFGSTDPHNDYLKILLENGIIGLLLYLNLIVALILNLFKKYLKLDKPNIKIFILVIFSITTSLYALSSVDNVLRNTALQWSFWVMIGGIMSSVRNKK